MRSFLGAFAKLQKTTISFVMSVPVSPHETIRLAMAGLFVEFRIADFVKNIHRKFRFC
jgi:hypothetical protein